MAKILVVDDEEDLCEILRFNLEAEGYAVSTVLSAEEALRLMSGGERFDLLLLDVMMECMSGYELARHLRALGHNEPIVFLTAKDAPCDELEGFAAGADDYITKPFSFDSVAARVAAVLRRSQPPAPLSEPNSVLRQQLTRREYEILHLLQQQRGRYFSRDEIMEAVWPHDACVTERSVDVHIARLRKKVAPYGLHIVNKSGFGYGLD